MRLLDKVLGSGNDELNEAEGFAGVALSAVASDGTITEDEAAALGSALQRMKLYADMSPRQVNQAFEKVLRLAREHGADALIDRAAAAVPDGLRATAFAVAADLLMADGHVADAERAFLTRLQRALGVPDDLAAKVVEVLGIKNRG